MEFNDGGTPAVEVGDRQGALYGLNLQTGAVAPGWGGGTGVTVARARDAAIPAGGRQRRASTESRSRGTCPIDSTASVNGNGDLYFGAGNASSPVDGGYYAYGPNGI